MSSKPETTKFRVKGNSASNRASWLAVKNKTTRNKKKNMKETMKERMERKRDLDEFKEKMRRRKRESFPYAEQLKDKRWLDFRKKVFKKRGRKCEVCGCKEHLQVHHIKYRYPKLAWEYDIKDVRVLCARCHADAHGKQYDYVAEMFGLK